MGLIEHATDVITQAVIGAAIEVHRRLGPGLLESAYQVCPARELEFRGIPYQSEVELPLTYRGATLGRSYIMDMVFARQVVLEIKATEKLTPIQSQQLLTYLRLSGMSAGLLINFNVRILKDGLRRLLC